MSEIEKRTEKLWEDTLFDVKLIENTEGPFTKEQTYYEAGKMLAYRLAIHEYFEEYLRRK